MAPDGNTAAVINLSPHGFGLVKVDPTGLVLFTKANLFFEGNGGLEQGAAVKIDPNGNTVVVGESATGKVGVMRYNALGSPDANFNMGRGPVLANFGYSQQLATGVDIDNQGNIVVVGTPFTATTQAHFLLLRIDNSGGIEQKDEVRGGSLNNGGWFNFSVVCYGSFYWIAGAMITSSTGFQNSLFKMSQSSLDFVSSFAHSGWMNDGIPGYTNSGFLDLAIDPVSGNPVAVGAVQN